MCCTNALSCVAPVKQKADHARMTVLALYNAAGRANLHLLTLTERANPRENTYLITVS